MVICRRQRWRSRERRDRACGTLQYRRARPVRQATSWRAAHALCARRRSAAWASTGGRAGPARMRCVRNARRSRRTPATTQAASRGIRTTASGLVMGAIGSRERAVSLARRQLARLDNTGVTVAWTRMPRAWRATPASFPSTATGSGVRTCLPANGHAMPCTT